ncbi:hypothetical protein JCM19297_579 [Nonlabens ulvanivorans]|nr:hypothetical protein JCM19297_579 [Nonlabens ulvanivorans]
MLKKLHAVMVNSNAIENRMYKCFFMVIWLFIPLSRKRNYTIIP